MKLFNLHLTTTDYKKLYKKMSAKRDELHAQIVLCEELIGTCGASVAEHDVVANVKHLVELVNSLRVINKDMREKHTSALDKCSDLYYNAKEADLKMMELEGRVSELNHYLVEKNKSVDNYKAKVAAMKKEAELSKEKLTQLVNDIAERDAKIRANDIAIESLKSTIAEFGNATPSADLNHDELVNRCEYLTHENERLAAEYEKLKKECTPLIEAREKERERKRRYRARKNNK